MQFESYFGHVDMFCGVPAAMFLMTWFAAWGQAVSEEDPGVPSPV